VLPQSFSSAWATRETEAKANNKVAREIKCIECIERNRSLVTVVVAVAITAEITEIATKNLPLKYVLLF
jgi:hypothetical protein